jgi:hypothetical protein
MLHSGLNIVLCLGFQIEDLNQQAQVAAAEKFKAPEVSPAAEAGGSTTVRKTSEDMLFIPL